MLCKFLIILFIAGVIVSCARSEKLDEDEMRYVKLTIAITNARIASKDSAQFVKKIDSVYSTFGTTKENYIKSTTNFSQQPERASIVFRAIADSLNIK